MIRKAIIYFLILTALLYSLRWLHYRGLLRQTSGYYAKYKTAFFEKNNFDVVFLGSSRVEMHYNTRLFDSITKRNSFNFGLQGATPQVAHAALKAYLLNSKPPEHLIYELDYHFLKYKIDVIREFNNYFPFLSNPVLRKEFSRIDGRMEHFYYNPYYSFPYTGWKNLSTGIHGWLNIENRTDSLYYKGYLKEVFRPQLDYIPAKPMYTYFNTTDRAYLDSIIILCRKNNMHLTLVTSPVFGGGKVDLVNKNKIISQLRNIADINHLSYYDLSSLPFCGQRELFVDHFHMNHLGAQKFTLIFGHWFSNKIAPVPLTK